MLLNTHIKYTSTLVFFLSIFGCQIPTSTTMKKTISRGSCLCSHNRTCEEPGQSCNCDANANKWFSDEGYYSGIQSLGITNMYFLQQKDLDEDSKGRLTLGPLECVETSKFEYNWISLAILFLLVLFCSRGGGGGGRQKSYPNIIILRCT